MQRDAVDEGGLARIAAMLVEAKASQPHKSCSKAGKHLYFGKRCGILAVFGLICPDWAIMPQRSLAWLCKP